MTWMTNGKRMFAKRKEFMEMLHVRDEGLNVPVGVRPHGNPESANKNKLQPFLVEKTLPNKKKAWVLNSFLASCIGSSATPSFRALVTRIRCMPISWI